MAFSTSGLTGPNVFSPEKSKVWETSGSGHWIEVVLPASRKLYDLSITTEDFQSYTPKEIVVSVVPLGIPQTRAFPTKVSTPPCDSTCTSSHDSVDMCVVCNKSWSAHSGHNCTTGNRGAFVSATGPDRKLSTCFPAKSLVHVGSMVLPQRDGEVVDLLTPAQCAVLQPSLVRLEIISTYGGPAIKLQRLRLRTTKRKSKRWQCRLCCEVNAERVLQCATCRVRRPAYDVDDVPPLTQMPDAVTPSLTPSSNASIIELDRFTALGEAKALAWNCSVDAWGRNQE
eukprot:gene21116-15613_t